MAAEDFLASLPTMLGAFRGASLSAHPLPRKRMMRDVWELMQRVLSIPLFAFLDSFW